MAAPLGAEDDVLQSADLKVLTISEVGLFFEDHVNKTRSRDPEYQPNPMLIKAMEYAQRFATNKNKDTVQKIREVIAHNQLSEMELGQVANLSIETVDEARKLVPSLDNRERFPDEVLENMLAELATYREFE